MEYCGGGSVADLVHAAEGPLEQPIIAYLCAETLAGLTYLHSIGKVAALNTEQYHRLLSRCYVTLEGCKVTVAIST